MKIKILLLFAFSLFMCQQTPKSFEVEIQNIKSFEKFNKNCNEHIHNENEVEIFAHVTENGDYLYSCTIYRLNDDTIRAFKAFPIDIHNYDRAIYKWANDSSLTFKFKNKYKDSKTYTIIGYISRDGNRITSLDWED